MGKKKTKSSKPSEPSSQQPVQLEEIRALLEDVLVAQHRTNQLLELALRAGFDDAEYARTRITQEDSP